jgi:hypothetical protein
MTTIKEWGSMKGPFPTLAPISKDVKVKHSIYELFTRKMDTTAGDWTDKLEFFLNMFDGECPAASAQGDMATSDLQDATSNVLAFSDMQILDANLAPLPRGNAADYPAGARNLARHFGFTVTAHPRHSNTGALDIDTT